MRAPALGPYRFVAFKPGVELVLEANALMHDKAMYAPLMEPALLGGYGPRVAEFGIGLITNMSSSAPYEDLRLKGP
jgi:ABC-type transport system substrate-binding protein